MFMYKLVSRTSPAIEENTPQQRKQMAGSESYACTAHLLPTRDKALDKLYCRQLSLFSGN